MTHANGASQEVLAYSWDWDPGEYARIVRVVQRHAKFAWVVKAFTALVLTTLVLGFLMAMYYVAVGAVGSALSLAPWLLIMLVWVVLLRWWVPRASAKAFRKVNHGRIHFSMSPVEVENGSETVSTKLRWAAFERAIETEEVILLFYTGNCALYLPKRAVPAGALATIRNTIRSNLGDRAKLES